MTSTTTPVEGSGAIVHIRADSDSTLEDLFDVVHKPPGTVRPLQLPFRMRKLPESFFRQPNFQNKNSPNSSHQHSRDNSIDLQDGFSPQPSPGGGNAPIHSRAHSSPATLQQTLAVAVQNNQQQHLHLRQPSYDVTASAASSSQQHDLGPLPPGWEIAKTPQGQPYFMNHIMKTTQWEDPRKQIHQQMLQQQLNNGGASSPRSPGSMSPVHGRSNSTYDPSGPLPNGWDQSETPEGEIYFINHTTKKTTWFDPRIPIHHQRVPIRQMDASQKRQQDMRLARLENERRAIQQRQAEIKRSMQTMRLHQHEQQMLQTTQDMLMRQNLNDSTSTPANNGATDPFLSSSGGGGAAAVVQQQQMTAGNSEIHNRQESADSGLGMGSNFNLGSIPEDMTGMDMETDLDTTLTANDPPTPTQQQQQQQQVQQQVQQQQQPNNGLTNVTNGGNGNDMDSTDALIPSIEAELDLSMQDVQSILNTNPNQNDNLTWL